LFLKVNKKTNKENFLAKIGY
jgi:hypothetical protein